MGIVFDTILVVQRLSDFIHSAEVLSSMDEPAEATFLECDAAHHFTFLAVRLLGVLFFSNSTNDDSVANIFLRMGPAVVLAVVEEKATGLGSGLICKKWTGLRLGEDLMVDGH
jgi:hypothetical protein